MNSKHRRTIAAILAPQKTGNLPFRDIVSLLRALGFRVEEGSGSRILFVRDDLEWQTHRPHPGKEARHYHRAQVKRLLEALGITL